MIVPVCPTGDEVGLFNILVKDWTFDFVLLDRAIKWLKSEGIVQEVDFVGLQPCKDIPGTHAITR